MKKHFKDLFKYNNWANEKLFIILKEEAIADEKILQLLGHTLTAQIVWYNRVKEIPSSAFPLWENRTLEELQDLLDQSSECWIKYMDEHRFDTFEEMIFYKNTKGKRYESTIREIITHVVNHGTHHRGQIVFRLRELGFEPPSLDYIFYCREK